MAIRHRHGDTLSGLRYGSSPRPSDLTQGPTGVHQYTDRFMALAGASQSTLTIVFRALGCSRGTI